MKQLFQKYGQFVGFDLTYNLVKDTIGPDHKKYKLGAILGLSACKKIVPFALVITLEDTKERMTQVFKSFGDIMGRMPKVVLSD